MKNATDAMKESRIPDLIASVITLPESSVVTCVDM